MDFVVAEAFFVDPVHEPLGEVGERRAEQVGDRHVPVLARPQQADGERPHLRAAGHAARFRVAQRFGQDGRLDGLHRGLLRGHVDVLAALRAVRLVQGDQRRGGRGRAGVQITLRHAEPDGRAVFVAGDDQRAAARQHDQVAVRVAGLGTVLSERGDGDVDQAGVFFGQVGIAQPVGGQGAGVVGLDEERGGARQLPQHVLPLGFTDVQGDAAFVAVVRPPVERVLRAALVLVERAEGARRRSAGRFDFDDVGSEVGQDLAAQQPAFGGQVEDAIRTQHAVTLQTVNVGMIETRRPAEFPHSFPNRQRQALIFGLKLGEGSV